MPNSTVKVSEEGAGAGAAVLENGVVLEIVVVGVVVGGEGAQSEVGDGGGVREGVYGRRLW